jgi:hypothetical protein
MAREATARCDALSTRWDSKPSNNKRNCNEALHALYFTPNLSALRQNTVRARKTILDRLNSSIFSDSELV